MRRLLFKILIFLATTGTCFSCKPEKDILPEDETEIPPDDETDSGHPFLIVKKEMFAELRARAASEPWKSMKADAISRSLRGSATKPYDLQYYTGAAALAYILDEPGRKLHAVRVRDAILNQYSKLTISESSNWDDVVPPLGSFFVAILSLDIVYDALSHADIEACEKVISDKIFVCKRTGSWADIRRGTHGTWDIYKGVRKTPDNDYYNGIMTQVTDDGVSPVTNHYAWERVGGGDSRISKSGYMDVLEFTGIDRRYYSSEKLRKFQRWLFGSSVNCSKEMAIFGDMLPNQGLNFDMLHMRVVNFDDEAAGYAAWFHHGKTPKGNIITYIIPVKALPEEVTPASRIFANGGAFFRDKEDDPSGLHGVLYNIKSQDEWHTHYEVNGLALSGYGNRLLVNGGRLGEPVRPAPLNNTLTINGGNHKSRLGGGITEGFTGINIDFACGLSGPALQGSTHRRSLIQTHRTDFTSPYFIIIDDVEASPGNKVKNYFHPANQTEVSEMSPLSEYSSVIDHYPTVQGAKVAFFYVTPPVTVKIEKVQSAVPDRYPGYPDHNRIESAYDVGATGKIKIITIIYPTGGTVAKPPMSRIGVEGSQGGKIVQSAGIADYVLGSDGSSIVTEAGVSFRGSAAVFRKSDASLDFYSVFSADYFSDGNAGLQSSGPVSAEIKGRKGYLLSSGSLTIILRGSGMQNLKITPSAEIIRTATDLIEMKLNKGLYALSE